MWPNPQFPTDSVTFTEEILNGKPHFLCSAHYTKIIMVYILNNSNNNGTIMVLNLADCRQGLPPMTTQVILKF